MITNWYALSGRSSGALVATSAASSTPAVAPSGARWVSPSSTGKPVASSAAHVFATMALMALTAKSPLLPLACADNVARTSRRGRNSTQTAEPITMPDIRAGLSVVTRQTARTAAIRRNAEVIRSKASDLS